MKTAISIPDDVFLEADQLARRLKKSRSELYSQAMREYLYRNSTDVITRQLNEVLDKVGTDVDPFVKAAGESVLRRMKS